MIIPVRQSGRAKAMEKARGPAAPVAPPLPRIPRVARLMALAIRFQDMVDRGEVRDYADLARLGHVTRARMSQIMNLLLLAPDIQENLLHTVSEISITERNVRLAVREVDWSVQRVMLSGLLEKAAAEPRSRNEPEDLFRLTAAGSDSADVQTFQTMSIRHS
jgi:hypothetical protein